MKSRWSVEEEKDLIWYHFVRASREERDSRMEKSRLVALSGLRPEDSFRCPIRSQNLEEAAEWFRLNGAIRCSKDCIGLSSLLSCPFGNLWTLLLNKCSYLSSLFYAGQFHCSIFVGLEAEDINAKMLLIQRLM